MSKDKPEKYAQLIYAIQEINNAKKLLTPIKQDFLIMKLDDAIELIEQVYDEVHDD